MSKPAAYCTAHGCATVTVRHNLATPGNDQPRRCRQSARAAAAPAITAPVVALVKSLASAIAIGSGSSVGREGPIIQIGSALGSALGQIVRMPSGQRIALIAAGAGAGIASTFNTPIGGVMFAIELMMPEVSVATFLPVAIATRDRNIRGSLVLWRYASLSRTVRCYQSLGVR